MFDAEVLLAQLAELGRQLDQETEKLGELDALATGHGCAYQRRREEYEDDLAEAFLSAQGSVEVRKNEARVKCLPSRILVQDAADDWEKAKGRVRTQQAAIKALTVRIDIGRSLLSHEKALIGLGQ